jgi:hypothetical protein
MDLPTELVKLFFGGVNETQPKNTVCKINLEASAKREDFVTFQVWTPTEKEKIMYATR